MVVTWAETNPHSFTAIKIIRILSLLVNVFFCCSSSASSWLFLPLLFALLFIRLSFLFSPFLPWFAWLCLMRPGDGGGQHKAWSFPSHANRPCCGGYQGRAGAALPVPLIAVAVWWVVEFHVWFEGMFFFLIYRYLFYFPFFSLSFFIIEISVQLRPSAAALPFEAIWFLRFIFFPLSNWKETPPPKKTNFHLFSLVFLLRMFRWRRTLMDAAITNTNSNKKMQHTHESSSSIFLSFNPERCGVEISTIELSAILTPPPSCLIH